MDYNFIHKSVKDFRRQFLNAGILLSNGYQLGKICHFRICFTDFGSQHFDFLLQLLLLRLIPVGQLVKAFIAQLPVDIILIDFAEQTVKLFHPLFVLFYPFLLFRKFKSPFCKRRVNLLSDKYPFKLL